MNDDQTFAYELVNKVYNQGVKPLIVEKEKYAYIKDPVFGIKRNRVISEILKSIIRSDLEKDEKLVIKLIHYLEKNQNKDGSWNEIHPNYNQPSALITSIVGESLLLAYNRFPSTKLRKTIELAKQYVVSQEISSGYFIKSKKFTADHLNVDATCGSFLALYGQSLNDEDCINTASRTAQHICTNQFSNGSFPYAIDKGNYLHLLNVPCIHYQGVTMYYLSKIHDVIKKEWLKDSLINGANWLVLSQKKDGRFNWSKSGLMFAYYLSGAYAFAFSSFIYLSEWDKKYLKNAELCSNILENNIYGIFLRWEKNPWLTFPSSIPITIKTSSIGDYPFTYKLFRFGYGLYRQIAIRRFSNQIDDKFFKNLTNILNIKSSTIESFSNYPDMFMTSEVLDCLSHSTLYHLRGKEHTL